MVGKRAAIGEKASISVAGAMAIGVGGMMGAGLYTLVGLAATTTGVWLPVAFLVGGAVSLFSAYSYVHLGVTFPSRGGAAQFLVECFGDSVVSGGLNIFQFLGWIIAMALYAHGFAGYALDLLPGDLPVSAEKAVAVGLILVVVAINLVGSRVVSRGETAIIVFELLVLAAFVVVGLSKAHTADFGVAGGDGILGIFFGAGLLYVTFEGFGVVTNAAGQMADPKRDLPRAMYGAVAIVIVVYVVVSTVIVATMSLGAIEAAQGHVLAEAGRAVLGRVGFVAIGVAALVATASAVNATLFGDANLAYKVARDGQLPAVFSRRLWLGGSGSLFVAAGLTAVFVLFFPLAAVGQMASLAFLVVYGTVSLGHLRIRRKTGAKAWVLCAAVGLNAALFLLLLGYTIRTGPATTWITLLVVFVLSFVLEAIYRRRTGRRLRRAVPAEGSDSQATVSAVQTAEPPEPRA